ncbi:MAG TPA: FHA domain-containing serine/threonine-protein kinase [Acidobacteriota bacterium]|nr:FHA domain-containing serine/threonine-protein kinase [Acidobacteriota bacterium]
MTVDQLKPDTMLSGRYRVVKRIGGGGMGNVYLVQDTRLNNRQRALKEMIGSFADDSSRQKAVQDFHREAELLASLEHPSIPTIYDYFDADGRYYLVMKFVPGGDLEVKMRKNGGKIEERQVVEWAIQICDVLHYIHNQNPPIIYRDLKPANLMIDDTMQPDRIVLVDFGIARFVAPTQKGVTAIGTMGYAPPELFAGKVEPRSDVYSLGATMFHLLTGVNPQDNPLLIFDFNKNPRPCELNPALTPEIDSILCRSVEHKASKRFSAAEMKVALEEHLKFLDSPRPAKTAMAPNATPRLVMLEPPMNVAFTLEKETHLIGRTDMYSGIFPEIDLTPFEKETKVSRRHATIYRKGDQFYIEDLKSSNGTYVGNLRLTAHQPYLLQNGDELQFGGTKLVFKAQ